MGGNNNNNNKYLLTAIGLVNITLYLGDRELPVAD
jgi:hypothetical protein